MEANGTELCYVSREVNCSETMSLNQKAFDYQELELISG